MASLPRPAGWPVRHRPRRCTFAAGIGIVADGDRVADGDLARHHVDERVRAVDRGVAIVALRLLADLAAEREPNVAARQMEQIGAGRAEIGHRQRRLRIDRAVKADRVDRCLRARGTITKRRCRNTAAIERIVGVRGGHGEALLKRGGLDREGTVHGRGFRISERAVPV